MIGVCDVPVVSKVCDVAGDAAQSMASAPFEWMAQAMGNAAEWMFEAVWSIVDSTTMVDVTSSTYRDVYNILFGIAVFVMVGFFLLQVMGAMIRREPAALTRGVLGLAKSVLGSFVALALLAGALEITDQLCIAIVHAAGTNMSQMGDRVALLVGGIGSINPTSGAAGIVITMLVAGLAIGAAVIVWISLLIRKALLLVAIVFAPIALAGASWDQSRGWISRWATFVIALILSKVVLMVLFLLATAQVSAPIDADLQSVGDILAGVVLMLIAGFAPYLTYKAISFMGFDSHHAISSEQEAKSALQRPLPTPLTRRGGPTPPKVLGATNTGTSAGHGADGSASPATSPRAAVGSRAGGGSGGAPGGTASRAGASAGSTTGAAAAAGGLAAGGLAAGAGIAHGAAAAGRRVGEHAGTSVPYATAAPAVQTPSVPPPHISDPVPGRDATRNR